MTEELRQTKVQLNESTFKLIKCEEELKTADQKYLKIQYDLRHLEDVLEDNKDLSTKLNQLRQDHEALQGAYSAEVEVLRASVKEAQVQQQLAVDPVQLAELRAQGVELMGELERVRLQNEELISQLKVQEAGQTVQGNEKSTFRNLYAALIRSRRILTLFQTLATTTSLAMPASNDEGGDTLMLAGLGSKRKRTE